MKVFLSDLRKHKWLWEVCNSNFKSLIDKRYYVFFYAYSEEQSDITVLDDTTLIVINESMYNLSDKIAQAAGVSPNIAYFQEPFDSDNTLFYLLLRFFISWNSEGTEDKRYEKLDKLFLDYKIKDLERINKQSASTTIGTFDIVSNSSLETALRRFIFKKQVINGLLKTCELLNTYFLGEHNKSFYSQVLTKVVKGVRNPNGGLIPEETGSMRYMIVGEKSVKGKNDEKLAEAKTLFRNGIDRDSIYKLTGWYNNAYDGKWRIKISDADFSLNMKNIKDYDLSDTQTIKLFVPRGQKKVDMVDVFENDNKTYKLLKSGYTGSLNQVVNHKLLFENYPQLATIPLFFGQYTNLENQSIAVKYYASDTPSYIYFRGQYEPNDKYILLHEIQHLIQHIEDFGNGGNPWFAELLQAVGGGDIRNYLLCYKKINEYFCTNIPLLANDGFKAELISHIEHSNVRLISPQNVRRMMLDKGSIKANCEMLSQIIQQYYTESEEGKAYRKFIEKNVSPDIYKLFLEINESVSKTKKKSKELSKKGWSDRALRRLFFNVYQSLAGEFESREVQQTTKIKPELKEYFQFYSSEVLQKKYINVLTNDGMPESDIKIFGGVETLKDKKYIIHLFDSVKAEPFLHELGHIVFDIVSEMQEFNMVADAYIENDASEKYDSIEHFFIECFLCYLIRLEIDKEMSENLKVGRKMMNFDKLDLLFNRIFLYEGSSVDYTQLESAQEYINELLKSMK